MGSHAPTTRMELLALFGADVDVRCAEIAQHRADEVGLPVAARGLIVPPVEDGGPWSTEPMILSGCVVSGVAVVAVDASSALAGRVELLLPTLAAGSGLLVRRSPQALGPRGVRGARRGRPARGRTAVDRLQFIRRGRTDPPCRVQTLRGEPSRTGRRSATARGDPGRLGARRRIPARPGAALLGRRRTAPGGAQPCAGLASIWSRSPSR